MKYLITALISVSLLSCATSQMTMYKPTGETKGWEIECVQDMGEYTLKIDGAELMTDTFGALESSFKKETTYKNHKVMMAGSYNQKLIAGSAMTNVKIRVMIDDSEVTSFDF